MKTETQERHKTPETPIDIPAVRGNGNEPRSLQMKIELAVLNRMLESDPNIGDDCTIISFSKLLRLCCENDEFGDERYDFLVTLQDLLKNPHLRIDTRNIVLHTLEVLDPDARFFTNLSENAAKAGLRMDSTVNKAEKQLQFIDSQIKADNEHSFEIDHLELNKLKKEFVLTILAILYEYQALKEDDRALTVQFSGLGEAEKKDYAGSVLFKRAEKEREKMFLKGYADYAVNKILKLFDEFEREYGCSYLN